MSPTASSIHAFASARDDRDEQQQPEPYAHPVGAGPGDPWKLGPPSAAVAASHAADRSQPDGRVRSGDPADAGLPGGFRAAHRAVLADSAAPGPGAEAAG